MISLDRSYQAFLSHQYDADFTRSLRAPNGRPNDAKSVVGTVYSEDNSGYMSRQHSSQAPADEAGHFYSSDTGMQDINPTLPNMPPDSSSCQGDYPPESDFNLYGVGLLDLNHLKDLTLGCRRSRSGAHGPVGYVPQQLELPSEVGPFGHRHSQPCISEKPCFKRPRLSNTRSKNRDSTPSNPSRGYGSPGIASSTLANPSTVRPAFATTPYHKIAGGRFACPVAGCKKVKDRECDLTYVSQTPRHPPNPKTPNLTTANLPTVSTKNATPAPTAAPSRLARTKTSAAATTGNAMRTRSISTSSSTHKILGACLSVSSPVRRMGGAVGHLRVWRRR